MKKVMLVFGTRPEAIKMAPLCKALQHGQDIKLIVCVTAQHREMLDQVLQTFDVHPDIDLDIMKDCGDLFEVTAKMVTEMRDVLSAHKPDLVVVHGDTATTFASALASFYSGIKVAHVEAGLRTNDIYAPFPEEFNRRATALVTNYHFVPTRLCFDRLKSEGVNSSNILLSGNTVVDALQMVLKKFETDNDFLWKTKQRISERLELAYEKEKFVLVTGHRRENLGRGFREICEAIRELASKYNNINFVYPVHLNPEVQKPVHNILGGLNNVWLIKPLAYEEFVYLMSKSYFVMTDSGGIQEEAPSLGKPVLVMRDTTERGEAIEAGTVKLVGTKRENIVKFVEKLICEPDLYNTMSKAHNPYGDGLASSRISNFIAKCLL